MNDLRRAKSAPRSGRGHQNADRSITALKNKIYYWTESRLEKLLPRLIIRRRQAWFAARLKALRSWPEFDKETLDYSWIQPQRGMDGTWYWPKSQLTIEWEALESAPHDSIDLVALREALAGLAAKALRNSVPLTLQETHFFGNGICVSETTAAAKLISHGSILLDFSPQAKTIQRILNRG